MPNQFMIALAYYIFHLDFYAYIVIFALFAATAAKFLISCPIKFQFIDGTYLKLNATVVF